MIIQRRDKNEPLIVAALIAAGCWVGKMDRMDGFDLLVRRDDKSWVMEVKMPGKEHDLTDNERKTKNAMEEKGNTYHVVSHVDYALEIIRTR